MIQIFLKFPNMMLQWRIQARNLSFLSEQLGIFNKIQLNEIEAFFGHENKLVLFSDGARQRCLSKVCTNHENVDILISTINHLKR